MKNRQLLTHVGFVLGLLLSLRPADAAPVPVLNVHRLLDSADLIVAGAVTTVRTVGPGTADAPIGTVRGTLMDAELKVDSVLKGPPTVSVITCQFLLPDAPMGYRGAAAGKYHLFFLKRAGDRYAFADPYHPYLPAVPKRPLPSASPLDGVVDVLSAVLTARTTAPDEKREAVYVLGRASTAEALSALRAALADRDQEIRLNAAASLLANNDLTGLPVAEQALADTDRSLPDDAVLNLRAAIARRLTADAAIPTLHKLLTTPSAPDETRRAAASALGHMHSPAALNSLGAALDDADLQVRMDAVIGLAHVSGQSNRAPSWDAFRAHQSDYIAYWKNWLKGR